MRKRRQHTERGQRENPDGTEVPATVKPVLLQSCLFAMNNDDDSKLIFIEALLRARCCAKLSFLMWILVFIFLIPQTFCIGV